MKPWSLRLQLSWKKKNGEKPNFGNRSLPHSHLSRQLKNKFIKKIPKDAEASNVLVGEVEFLEKPFVAFVRLLQATMLGGVTEVPVPTR